MFTTNPFATLAETIPMMAIQTFVIVMVGLVILGTVIDIIHKKNVKYFFNNAKKAKKSAKRELGTGERLAVIGKTIIQKDKFFGEQEILDENFVISFKSFDYVSNEQIQLEYQGCFDNKICFNKETKRISI